MICCGIDAGSRTIKVVLMDSDMPGVLASGAMDQGTEQEVRAQRLIDGLLAEKGLGREAVWRTAATGYGRNIIRFADDTITEITCQARGVRHLLSGATAVVDIGGQDSKFIRMDARGVVQDFAMNDRCAAGTGCFLEVVAARFGLGLEELGRLAARSRERVAINSTCVVFAETEIIGLLAAGCRPEDIVAGVQAAIATRVATMVGRSGGTPVVFTGGVALIPGMDVALESALGRPVTVAPQALMTGALGAAILACEHLEPKRGDT